MSITNTQNFTRAINPLVVGIGNFQDFTRSLVISNEVELVIDGAPPGLAGLITVSIVTFDGTLVVYPPNPAGIEELPASSGRYTVTVDSPPVGHYFAVWTDGATVGKVEFEIVADDGSGPELITHRMNGAHWPDATEVNVYPAMAWVDPTRAPSGSAVATATVDQGAAVFFGLSPKVRYVAYADGLGIAFMAQPWISEDIQSTVPGQERERAVEERLTRVSALVLGASSVLSPPTSDETAARMAADASLAGRLDQLEAAGGTEVADRLDALEAAMASLQITLASLEGLVSTGTLYADQGASWSAP